MGRNKNQISELKKKSDKYRQVVNEIMTDRNVNVLHDNELVVERKEYKTTTIKRVCSERYLGSILQDI